MIVFISVLSFILDGILSRYVGGMIWPLFTIVSLVLIYPYFRSNDFQYFKYSAILGLLYDISYANTIFFNFFIFLILGFVVMMFYYFFSNRIYITAFISFLLIILYRIITMLFLILFKSYEISFQSLLESIYSSLFINIMYCIIMYVLTSLYSKKHHILKK